MTVWGETLYGEASLFGDRRNGAKFSVFWAKSARLLAALRNFKNKNWLIVLAYLWIKPTAVKMIIQSRRVYAKLVLSSHFDPKFYTYCYGHHLDGKGPLAHYLDIGRHLRFDPSPDFSVDTYLKANSDILSTGEDPFYFFLRSGERQGRLAQPSSRKVEYFTGKQFDEEFYVNTYVDVRESGDCPLLHYINVGWKEGRNPNKSFSTQYYMKRYSDVAASNLNPLYHFVLVGQKQGRTTSDLPRETPNPLHAPAPSTPGEGQNALLTRLVQRQPEIATKWMSSRYLSTAFNSFEGLSALLFHYRYLMASLSPETMQKVLFGYFDVWSEASNDHAYRITLKLADPVILEGEFSLEFRTESERLYVLSFTVVPGELVGLPVGPAILVSRLQGDGSKFSKIKSAAKDFRDVAPSFMLFAALQGVAKALNISNMAGVASAFQTSNGGVFSDRSGGAYDHFFEAVGAVKTSQHFYTSALPISEKPLSAVKQGHRLRTKAKRLIKSEVARIANESTKLGLRTAWYWENDTPKQTKGVDLFETLTLTQQRPAFLMAAE